MMNFVVKIKRGCFMRHDIQLYLQVFWDYANHKHLENTQKNAANIYNFAYFTLVPYKKIFSQSFT